MDLRERVLAALEQHGGDYLSGETLAGMLGVSRTAVWKAVRTLRREGYNIDAVTNQGYRLHISDDRLSERAIRRQLTVPVVPQVHASVDSTNTRTRQAAEAGAEEGLAILADRQTAGRGRRGRTFFSPAETGLYLTLLLRPTMPAERAAMLTAWAAVAVAQAVETVSGRGAGIKWVNDIYMDGKKVCGILTEAVTDLESGRLDYAVIGIGINLYTPERGFPEELAKIAGSVFSTPEQAPCVDRNRLAAEILNRLWDFYQNGDEKFLLNEYRKRSILTDREVTVHRGDECYPATVRGIDDDYRLILERADGTVHTLGSGEVSVRPMEGKG